MSFVTVSSNMLLPVPVVGVELGPQYAVDVNSSLNIIDSHNHSVNSGVQITPNGLNINADLSINTNNLTLVNTVRFQPNVSEIPATAPNIGCVYVAGNELYYNDVSGGHEVQITNNGNVNAGAGSIGGLPSGTASVNFAGGNYVFQSATNVAATIDVGSIILRNNTISSNGLTLQAPTLSSNYPITLPALPASGLTQVVTLDSAGSMGIISYDQIGQNMTSIGANAIIQSSTRSVDTDTLGQVAVTLSCGLFSTHSTTFVTVSSLNASTPITGERPVWVGLQPDTSGNPAGINIAGSGCQIQIVSGSRVVYKASLPDVANAVLPPGVVWCVDYSAIGLGPLTIPYTVQVASPLGFLLDVSYCVLVVYEIT